MADEELPEDRMSRITVRMPAELVAEVDALVEDGQYLNRSEAIRDAIRTGKRVLRNDHRRPLPRH